MNESLAAQLHLVTNSLYVVYVNEPTSGDPRHGPLPLLLISLIIVTGLVDAVSYLALGDVFVASMTGNVVFQLSKFQHGPQAKDERVADRRSATRIKGIGYVATWM
jgi:uncharacterized protein DUF1275